MLRPHILTERKFSDMKKILAVILAVIFVLAAFSGCSGAQNGPKSEYDVPVMQVGDMQYTLNDINYMYVNNLYQIRNEFYYIYGVDLFSVIDLKKDLSEQTYGDNETWHDFLIEYTEESIKYMTVLYLAAKEENFELTDKYKDMLDAVKSDLEKQAEDYGSSVEDYITAMYGAGMDYDTVYKITEINYYAAAYGESVQDSLEVTEEEMREYYESNKKDYDTVNFRFCSFFYADDIENYTDDDVAAYREKAEAVAKAATEEEFKAAVLENVAEDKKSAYEKDGATLYRGAAFADIGYEGLANWLFDEARKPGDTYVYEDEENGGFIPVMFVERVSADYEPVDVRHILIMPEKDEDGNASDEAWAAAEEKAKEVLNEFLAGDKTEDTFASLAQEKTEDGGSQSNGGLYSGVTKGQMVVPFEEWCFAENRQPGDTDIVKSEYGYHVMYFSGRGENNIYSTLKSKLVTEKFDKWLDDLSDRYEIEKLDAFEKVGGMIAEIAQAAEEHANAQESEDSSSDVSESEVSEQSGAEASSEESASTSSEG